ncbi:porin family protein [Grimontia sp. AD028]|uniref:porin family protein n=1 Tax=Grimontia sp. AD028 TaxID=1581149 RepID=UPI000697670D|nr:porin family protein [Grimontia sp. AD028]
MKKSMLALAVVFASFGAQANDFSGSRIGAGYNLTAGTYVSYELKGINYGHNSTGDGFNLTYGYDFNQMVGLNISYYETSGDKRRYDHYEFEGSSFLVDADIGWTFDMGGWSIKPYGAVGLGYHKMDVTRTSPSETVKSDSFSETGFLFGVGARAQFNNGAYLEVREDILIGVDHTDSSRFALIAGYKF